MPEKKGNSAAGFSIEYPAFRDLVNVLATSLEQLRILVWSIGFPADLMSPVRAQKTEAVFKWCGQGRPCRGFRNVTNFPAPRYRCGLNDVLCHRVG